MNTVLGEEKLQSELLIVINSILMNIFTSISSCRVHHQLSFVKQ